MENLRAKPPCIFLARTRKVWQLESGVQSNPKTSEAIVSDNTEAEEPGVLWQMVGVAWLQQEKRDGGERSTLER